MRNIIFSLSFLDARESSGYFTENNIILDIKISSKVFQLGPTQITHKGKNVSPSPCA